MSAPEGFHAMHGAKFLSGKDDPDVAAENECRDIGGVHYCVGSTLSLGHLGDGPTNDTGIGLLFMTRRGGGRTFGRPDAKGNARLGRSPRADGAALRHRGSSCSDSRTRARAGSR
jgi:hypothetical protein